MNKLREVRAIKRLSYSNIINLIEVLDNEEPNSIWINGNDLYEAVKGRKTFYQRKNKNIDFPSITKH